MYTHARTHAHTYTHTLAYEIYHYCHKDNTNETGDLIFVLPKKNMYIYIYIYIYI